MTGKTIQTIGVAALGALLAGIPAAAHHSLSTKYQTAEMIMLQGTVTKVEWSNPHAKLYIDAPGAAGMIEMWDFEMASPNLLTLNGLKIDSFRKGDRVLISAYPSRDGSHQGYATKVTLAGSGH